MFEGRDSSFDVQQRGGGVQPDKNPDGTGIEAQSISDEQRTVEFAMVLVTGTLALGLVTTGRRLEIQARSYQRYALMGQHWQLSEILLFFGPHGEYSTLVAY